VKILFILALALAAHKDPVRRARPPKFDRHANSIFMENAFELLEGERPLVFNQEANRAESERKEDVWGNGDFDRGDMMAKLEAAEASIAESLSDKKTFGAATHKIDGGADIVVMMGRTLFNNDPDYGTDDDYLKFAEDMTTAAKQLKVLARKGDYEGAAGAFGRIRKNCNACHDGFRL